MNIYTVDPHCAELYDQVEQSTEDAALLLDFIGQRPGLTIFEPFCGTGRLLIPLARAGHDITGMDSSPFLLQRCREKLDSAGLSARLIQGDALTSAWPGSIDIAVLGSNCLYELASSEEQEQCIRSAAGSLKPGGYLFLDNNHMEGSLAPAWQDTSEKPAFPTGLCSDGIRLESTMQLIWCDTPARLARFRRSTRVTAPDGSSTEYVYEQQKHPVSTEEVKAWLERSGFQIKALYGSRDRQPYTHDSPRAIFWARKLV